MGSSCCRGSTDRIEFSESIDQAFSANADEDCDDSDYDSNDEADVELEDDGDVSLEVRKDLIVDLAKLMISIATRTSEISKKNSLRVDVSEAPNTGIITVENIKLYIRPKKKRTVVQMPLIVCSNESPDHYSLKRELLLEGFILNELHCPAHTVRFAGACKITSFILERAAAPHNVQ